MIQIRKSNERGHDDHGWLNTYHTFSFASYYDSNWMGFETLRVINDDIVATGEGFGTHPHADMEIITYILSGQLEHKDSMGNGRIIQTGEVQYMAAGTGIQHSEFNPSTKEPVHLLQIWIQPDAQGYPPSYAEKSFANAPTAAWNLVTSKTGRDNSISINQDADLYLAKLNSNESLSHQLLPNRKAWLHVAEGEITLNGETLSSGDAAAITEATALNLEAQTTAQVLLFDLA